MNKSKKQTRPRHDRQWRMWNENYRLRSSLECSLRTWSVETSATLSNSRAWPLNCCSVWVWCKTMWPFSSRCRRVCFNFDFVIDKLCLVLLSSSAVAFDFRMKKTKQLIWWKLEQNQTMCQDDLRARRPVVPRRDPEVGGMPLLYEPAPPPWPWSVPAFRQSPCAAIQSRAWSARNSPAPYKHRSSRGPLVNRVSVSQSPPYIPRWIQYNYIP